MKAVGKILDNLQNSKFRREIRLHRKEAEYLNDKGLETVLEHAADFVEKRLAPAEPANDGKQTPRRNHPVFVAQHATATCCRGCLEKWHDIPKGKELDEAEKRHIIEIIERWLSQYLIKSDE
ncbi:MAG: DUF4186 domain-containing protein [Acidobacteriota bacterium]|nr:DUF4186 domain-containing protein [Acidobacteriota bacterium]